MRTIGRPGKKTYVPCLRIELPGSFMRRCLHIELRLELRLELYAKGALCGSTLQLIDKCQMVSGEITPIQD